MLHTYPFQEGFYQGGPANRMISCAPKYIQ
jgi:hypothetical protein